MSTRSSLIALLVVAGALGAGAQTTTGRLMGATLDESGAVLPGATVSISSPALIGGAQVKVTDERGEFSFLSLAPGDYTVRASLAGFVTQERTLVRVPLGGAAVIDLAMPTATFAGEIEVVDETPVVDPTQVTTGQVFRADYLQSSAIGIDNRAYYTVVKQNAAVGELSRWSGVPQPQVLGSTLGENAYFIDGMDATNPTTGIATAVINFDAIGEIQLQTGGFEAEYGRATGGIINVVSKSGGNQFSGTFDARYRDDAMQESGDHFDAGTLSTSRRVFSATLGGPIVRDRLWFFASAERISDLFTPAGSPATRDQQGKNYLGKITWQAAPAWRVAGKYTSDPTTWEEAGACRQCAAGSNAFKLGTSIVFSAELTSVLGDSLLWGATLGRYGYESNVYPQHGDLAAIGHYNLYTDEYTVSYGTQQYWETSRKDFTTDLTWFLDDLAGSHELKVGVEYSDLNSNGEFCSTGTPNGERCVPGGSGLYFGDIDAGGALPYVMWESYTAGPSSTDGTVSTLFVQDAWRPLRNLTLKLGLRYDVVTYDTGSGVPIADMDLVQPRLGAAWDLTGDAKTVLRGSWGRFMHPDLLTLPSSGVDLSQLPAPEYQWYSCSTIMEASSAPDCAVAAADMGWGYRTDPVGWDPYGWVLAPWEVYASEPSQTDPNLRATYADELIVAFEREVGKRSSVEIAYVDKRTRGVIDDTCNGNWPTPSADAACVYYIVANIPALKRDYRGLMLSFETRRYSWLTLLASYTYSSAKGSLEYSQGAENEVDLYPWQYDNIYGYLSDHRRHRLKLNGFLTIKGDWSVAFDARWSSPFTWTPYENEYDNPAIPFGGHLLEPRGSREGSSSHQVDLQLAKGFTVGPVRLVLIGTVLNALSTELTTGVCDHISGCGFDEDGNPIAMGDPTGWQVPRRYEVGFRMEF